MSLKSTATKKCVPDFFPNKHVTTIRRIFVKKMQRLRVKQLKMQQRLWLQNLRPNTKQIVLAHISWLFADFNFPLDCRTKIFTTDRRTIVFNATIGCQISQNPTTVVVKSPSEKYTSIYKRFGYQISRNATIVVVKSPSENHTSICIQRLVANFSSENHG